MKAKHFAGDQPAARGEMMAARKLLTWDVEVVLVDSRCHCGTETAHAAKQ